LSTAEFAAKLNRRHKAALCSTLICVGLIVLLGGAVRPAVGVGLLGLAFSWALGSDNRPLHWLFVICGLLLLVVPMANAFLWPREKSKEIKSQMSIIESDRRWIKEYSSLIAERTAAGITSSAQEEEESSKQSNELFKDEQELRSLQAEGVFRHVMRDDWGNVAGGLLLLSSGLGLIIGINPVRQD
jgi:hypothetical protein